MDAKFMKKFEELNDLVHQSVATNGYKKVENKFRTIKDKDGNELRNENGNIIQRESPYIVSHCSENLMKTIQKALETLSGTGLYLTASAKADHMILTSASVGQLDDKPTLIFSPRYESKIITEENENFDAILEGFKNLELKTRELKPQENVVERAKNIIAKINAQPQEVDLPTW